MIKIKERYEDFIVQEINENGEIANLKEFPKSKEEYLEEINKSLKEISGKGDQLVCIMQKRNTEALSAIRDISKKLRISKKRIGYAGLKDKRSISAQFISIYRPDLKLLKRFYHRDIFLHSFKWSNEKIDLGNLKGNFFKIKIKNCSKKALQSLKQNLKEGIPNKFGEQRFGSVRKINHIIGKEIIKGNTKKAVELFLEYSSNLEKEEIRKARLFLKESKNYVKSEKLFPKSCYKEKAVLQSLIKNPNDYNNAFMKLGKSFCKIFIHAYQSYLFNKYIDLRVSKYALKKIDGDFIANNEIQAPLFGYDFIFAEKKAGALEKNILKKEGISLKDFKIKNFPELSAKGSRRDFLLKSTDYKIIKIKEDYGIISFSLKKGNYATTVIDYLKVLEQE